MRRLLLLSPLALLACSSPKAASTTIPASSYTATFDAARQVLADYRFELDRIDAHAGVITTRPKSTSGLATPWDREQQSLSAEWEDLINQQTRRVRVAFVPARTPASPSDAPRPKPNLESQPSADELPPDLLTYEGPLTLTVSATIQRIERPGWRPDARSIAQSTFTADPARDLRYNAYAHDLRTDPDLAGALLAQITSQASLPAPQGPAAAAVDLSQPSQPTLASPTQPKPAPKPQPKPQPKPLPKSSITPAEAFGTKPLPPKPAPPPNPNDTNSPPPSP